MYKSLYEGLHKDLTNVVKTESGSRGSSKLQDWIAAIINHLYYIYTVPTSVCTTLTDRADIVEAKWKSLLNHVTTNTDMMIHSFRDANTQKPNTGLKRRSTIQRLDTNILALEFLQYIYELRCYHFLIVTNKII